ncbi:MAG: AAA family ATPase [Thermoplasmata archaeon]|nr:AAA family ATPase [Thermoplasmata archaeon]
MKRIVIASVKKGAGKTSLIVGLARNLKVRVGYVKPFGERVIYRNKEIQDLDSSLMKDILHLGGEASEMSIGYDHSKLRYLYDKEKICGKLMEMAETAGEDKDVLLVEGGDITSGASVHLDPISIARGISGKLVFVVSGDDDTIMDDITFVRRYVDMENVDFAGVVVNKVQNVSRFRQDHLKKIREKGVPVLGVLPYKKELNYLTMNFISDSITAKVLAGEEGLGNRVKTVLVGSLSADRALNSPHFHRENKLIITAGDRHDMILGALGSNTAGVLLTNNILPSSKLLALAGEKSIPLLLVSADTFQVAKMIDDMEPLLTSCDEERIALLEEMVKNMVELDGFQ